MGDLRNKARYYERQALIQRQLLETWARTEKPVRCQCGLRQGEVPIMWCLGADKSGKPIFHCPACLPPKYLPLVAVQVANLPDPPEEK